MPKSAAANIEQMYQGDPNVVHSPQLVSTLAMQNSIPATDVSASLKFLGGQTKIQNSINTNATSPGAPHSTGFWGSVVNMFHSIVNSWGNSVLPNGAPQSLGNQINRSVSDTANFAKGVGNEFGANGAIGGSLLSLANRAGTSAQELGGFKGLAGYGDLTNTIENIPLSIGNLVNPFSSSNGFELMRHTIAYYESIAARRGWDYALGQMAPSVAMMLATGGSYAPEASIEEAANEQTLLMLSEKEAQGVPLTPQEQEALVNAQEKQRIIDESKMNLQKAQAEMGGANRLRQTVANAVERIPNPAVGAYRLARQLGKPLTDIRANAMYLMNQATAGNSAATRDLWNKTQGGMVIGADGKPKDLATQTLMYLGVHPDSMFFAPSSGLFNLYTKYIGSDPLGATGKFISGARSVEGLPGLLGTWFRGFGIRTADDVYRLSSVPAISRAFEYMATHSASEIQRMFSDGMRSTYSRSMLVKLGDASTVGEVMSLHADMADARGFTVMRAPTIGTYTAIKKALTGAFTGHTVQSVLSGSYGEIEKAAMDLTRGTGMNFLNRSTLYRVTEDPGLRYRATFRQWVRVQLLRRPMYYSELASKISTRDIIPGDYSAIPAIVDMAKAAFVPENVANAMGDFLLETRDPNDFVTAYRNILKHIVARRVVAAMPKPEWDAVSYYVEKFVDEEVNRLGGFDGAGRRGIYVAGQNGERYSIHEIEGQELSTASGQSQFGHLIIPEARDLNNLSRRVREVLMTSQAPPAAKNLGATFTERQALELAASRNLKGTDSLSSAFGKMSNYRLRSDNPVIDSLEKKKGYEGAIKDLKKFGVDGFGFKSEDNPTEAQKFVAMYQKAKTEYMRLLSRLNDDVRASEFQLPSSRQFSYAGNQVEIPTTPLSREVRDSLVGQAMAYRDGIVTMNMSLHANEDLVTLADLKSIAESRASEMKLTETQKRMYSREYTKTLDEMRQSKSGYRSNFQLVNDNLNRFLSRTFVPLALLSGRWAMHVGMSEGILNSLRVGGRDYFDSMVARSIAKHELTGPPLARGEAALIRDVVGRMVSAAREIGAGVVLGFERRLLRDMNPDQYARMIDDFTAAIMAHDGHLPVGVHQQDDFFRSGDAKVDVGEPSVYEVDTGNPELGTVKILRSNNHEMSRVLQPSGRLNPLHHIAWTEHAQQIASDPLKRMIAVHLNAVLEAQGHIDFSTAEKGSEQWLQDLKNTLLPNAEEAVHRLPPEIKSRMEALRGPLADRNLSSAGMYKDGEEATQAQIESDLAKAQVEDVVSTVLGSHNEYRIHQNLLDQITSGEFLSPSDQARLFRRLGKNAPDYIPASGFRETQWLQEGAWKNLFVHVSNVGHDKILGPIVNGMVRDPLYLLEYHRQMEFLRTSIYRGHMTEDEARLMAEQRASQKMFKFVHNPKDKAVFEKNMRTLAPFYFAKNQAWRRAFRMAGDDPGAFEKYMKLSLAMTNYVSSITSSGSSPLLAIPGSEFLGKTADLAGWAAGTPPGWGSLDFGLSGSPGSVQSIVPTGDLSGWRNLLGNFVTPPWGPLVTVSAKELAGAYQAIMGPSVLLQKWMRAFLGPIESNMPLYRDLLPNGMLNDMWEIVQGQFNSSNSTGMTIQNEVWNNALDNLFAATRANVLKNFAGELDKMPPDERNLMIRNLVDTEVSTTLNNPTSQHEFIDRAHASMLLMMTMKMFLNFISPLSLSVDATFTKSPEFDAMLKQKTANGEPVSYTQIANEFATKFPNNVLDLLAHSSSTYSNYPETEQVLQMLENNPDMVNKYPYASAFLNSRAGTFSLQAYQMELSMNLRARETPEQFYTSAMVGIGNDWYYNFLEPYLMRQVEVNGKPQFVYPEYAQMVEVPTSNGTKLEPQLTYQGSKMADNIAKQYGQSDNPLWYNEHAGKGQTKNVAYHALEEMTALLKDPSVTYLSASDKEKFQTLINNYNDVINRIHQLKADGNTAVASRLENAWYGYTQVASQEPAWSKQSYFISSVLAQMPTL